MAIKLNEVILRKFLEIESDINVLETLWMGFERSDYSDEEWLRVVIRVTDRLESRLYHIKHLAAKKEEL